MSQFTRRLLCVVLLASPSMVLCVAAQTGAAAATQPGAAARLKSAYGKLPLAFEPNRGQTDPQVQFLSRTPNATLFLTGADAVLETSTFKKNDPRGAKPGLVTLTGSASVRMHLAGAAAAPAVTPERPLPGATNYLTGQDRSKWQTNVPNYAQVRLAGVYPGIDLTYYGNRGRLEYDFVVAPHADASRIRLQFQGTQARLDANGNLVLPLAGGTSSQDLSFAKPVVYQTIAGKRIPVEAGFQLAANHDVTFRIADYDHAHELVIDPQLIYIGTLGTGQNNNNLSQIVLDSTGALYFVGTTQSSYYPVTPGAYQTVCGPAEGSAASNGVVYCNGPSGTANGQSAAYVSKLSADGGTLLYSTFISGHLGYEGGNSIAVDSTGVAYILGQTASNDFPITGDAYQPLCGPNQPYGFETQPVQPSAQCDNFSDGGGTEYTINGPVGFMAKLSANGSSLLYSSFLGGSDAVYTVNTALDSSGNWYVYGQTSLRQQSEIYGFGGGLVSFPFTSSGYQSAANPPNNGMGGDVNAGSFLAKFSNDGTELLYGTYFGDITYNVNVLSAAMALGQNGVAFIGGYSLASQLPTTSGTIKQSCSAVQSNPVYCTTYDGFVAAIDTTKSGAASLVYSTRLGGSTAQGSNIPNNEVLGLMADASNDVFATGYTYDTDFQTTSGTYDPSCPQTNGTNCNAAFLDKINPTGSALLAGTLIGSPAGACAVGYNVGTDAAGLVYLYGQSCDGGGDFPQVNSLQAYQSGNKLFVSTFSADLADLLFSTRFGNPLVTNMSVNVQGGMQVSPAGNIYFAGETNEALFGVTPGTYNSQTTNCCTANHSFFAEISNVLLANSTTAVSVSPASVQTGANVTVTAKVTGAGATPTGTAALYLDGVLIDHVTLAKGTGTVTIPATNVAKGAHAVGAIYGGNTVYGSSTSITSLTITPYATSLTVAAAPTSTYVGQSVTLTATAKRTTASGTPTGSVTFYGDGVAVATVALNASGVASFAASTAGLGAATYSVTAKYAGDGLDAASTAPATSVTLVALNATTTTLTASPNPVTPPAKCTLTATVARAAGGAAGTPTGSVTFSVDTTVLGKATLNGSGVATFSASTQGLSAGTYPVVAKYSGDSADATSTSSTASVTVQ